MTKEDYMHLPKERLAEMLAERDLQKIEPIIAPVHIPPYDVYTPPYEWWRNVVYCQSSTNDHLEGNITDMANANTSSKPIDITNNLK